MPTKKNELTFEQAMERLSAIVAQLEKGDAPLEEALALFEEGTSLMKQCSKALDEAEQKVSLLFPSSGGEPVTEPFATPWEEET